MHACRAQMLAVNNEHTKTGGQRHPWHMSGNPTSASRVHVASRARLNCTENSHRTTARLKHNLATSEKASLTENITSRTSVKFCGDMDPLETEPRGSACGADVVPLAAQRVTTARARIGPFPQASRRLNNVRALWMRTTQNTCLGRVCSRGPHHSHDGTFNSRTWCSLLSSVSFFASSLETWCRD